MNFESTPENTEAKKHAENIAAQFLQRLESIENQTGIVDMKADSGEKMHVPVLERDGNGGWNTVWVGKTTWDGDIGPMSVNNHDALRENINNVKSVLDLLEGKLKEEVEDGILRADIYLLAK